MRAAATILSSLVMALAAIGLAVAAPGPDLSGPQASLAAASGGVSIVNSREGHAVLSATDLRPGQTVSGTVDIGNDGDTGGRFTVAATGVTDTPRGLLSHRLVIGLADVTDAAAPHLVFAGTPAALGEYDVGTLAPGTSRTFRVTATLPGGGAGDNAYQGSSLSMGLEWHATVVATLSVPTATPTPATATPTPTPTAPPKAQPTPTPTPAPTATPKPARVSIADLLGLPPASHCVKSSRMTFKLKAPPGTKLGSAVVSAGGKTLRLQGAKLRKAISLRGLRKTVKLKVTARASNGRTYKASRSYEACANR
jgi:spore coat-associated protein N